ncbi:unnamed protein product, partial [Symbiodinium sp. KB8]
DEEGPQDIETTIRELQVRPGFEGYFLFNDLGIPIKWSSSGFGENSASSGVIIPREVTHFAALMADLSAKSQDTCDHLFADKDRDDTRLRCIRLRTRKREIIVAPGDGCTLVVLQAAASFTDASAEADEAEDE